MKAAVRLLALLALSGAAGVRAQLPAWQSVQTPMPVSGAYAVGADNPSVVIALDLSSESTYYVLHSSDGGISWVVSNAPPRNGFQALYPSPTDSSVAYLVIGGGPGGGGALSRTADAGASWNPVTPKVATPDGYPVGQIVVGASPLTLYGTRMELYDCPFDLCQYVGTRIVASDDGGATWRYVAQPRATASNYIVSAAPSDSRVLYTFALGGGAPEEFYRSADNGATWTRVLSLAMNTATVVSFAYAVVDRRDASTIYLPTGTDTLISSDGGQSWRSISLPAGVNTLNNPSLLFADPRDAGRVYNIDKHAGIFESRDRGSTWTQVVQQLPGTLYDALVGADSTGRVFYGRSATGFIRVALPTGTHALGSDLWWNPAESGMGFTITQHASGQAFVVWYRYDATGKPIWYVMPGGTWSDDKTFTGPLFVTKGPPYFSGPFDPSRVTVQAVGEATLVFSDTSHATFSYQLSSGEAGAKAITRELPGNGGTSSGGLADLWWNPQESGWGIVVSQHGTSVFATWFVYDANGDPTWLVVPNGNAGPAPTVLLPSFSGDLYTTLGPPSSGPYDPSKVVATHVGTMSGQLSGTDALGLSYSIQGQAGQRTVARQPF